MYTVDSLFFMSLYFLSFVCVLQFVKIALTKSKLIKTWNTRYDTYKDKGIYRIYMVGYQVKSDNLSSEILYVSTLLMLKCSGIVLTVIKL